MVSRCRKEKVFTQGITFSPYKFLPPQVFGQISENLPPAKITQYYTPTIIIFNAVILKCVHWSHI